MTDRPAEPTYDPTDVPALTADLVAAEAPPVVNGHRSRELSAASARRTRAVRLRLAGATYEQIAAECGYVDRSNARKSVLRALDALEVESVAELRTVENARLDQDEVVLRTLISNVKLDPTVRLRAIDTRTRLSARRSRLNGLDAPVAVTLSAGAAAGLEDALTELEAVVMGDTVPGEVTQVTDERMEG